MLLNPVVSSATNRHRAITLPLLIFCFQVLANFTPWIIDWHLKLFACVMQHATIWQSNAPLHIFKGMREFFARADPAFIYFDASRVFLNNYSPPLQKKSINKCCSGAIQASRAVKSVCEARARGNTLFSAERTTMCLFCQETHTKLYSLLQVKLKEMD